FSDLDKDRIRLRNVPFPSVHGVGSRERVFGGPNIVEANQAKVLPNRLWSIAEVARGSSGLSIDQGLDTVGGGPEGGDEWQHARLQIGNRTAARPGSNRRQALARAVIRHNRELAQCQALLISFVVPKQKQLVLLDGASQGSPKLIPLERTLDIIEEVPGIQGAVAQKLERASVPLVRPGGRHNADLPAGAFSVLGAIGVRQNVVFPHCVHTEQLAAGSGRRNEKTAGVPANVVDAIDHKTVGFRPLARYGERRPLVVLRIR